MNEKEIYWKLNQHLKIVQQNYPIENIFGIFVIEIGDNEIESEAIIVPTFETICTSISHINTHIENILLFMILERFMKQLKWGIQKLFNYLKQNIKL